MRPPFLRVCRPVLAVALCAVALLCGDGVTARGCVSPGGEGPGIGPEWMRDVPALAKKARMAGSLKVLVRLRVPGMLSGDPAMSGGEAPLSPSEGDRDLEERIRVVAESVQKELGAARYSVYRRYTSLPFIAIEASPEAIEALASIPDVAGVTEDTARPLR